MENNGFHMPDTQTASEDQIWGKSTIRSLRLKPVVTIKTSDDVASAIEIMSDNGYDQLPVLDDKQKLVGLVTLGNLLSFMSHGRATPQTHVSKVMFDFTKIKEVITYPHKIGSVKPTLKATNGNSGPKDTPRPSGVKRRYDEITLDTSLSALSRFFEHNSAGIVTERRQDGDGFIPIHVVTKVDLLSSLVKKGKVDL